MLLFALTSTIPLIISVGEGQAISITLSSHGCAYGSVVPASKPRADVVKDEFLLVDRKVLHRH